MAQITIDARKYFDFGIGTYIRHLADGLARLRSPHSFRLLISPNDAKRIIPPQGWDVDAIPYGKYSLGEIFLMGKNVNTRGLPSVFHSPHYTLPVGLENRSVVTIHDMIPLRLPHLFSFVQRLYAFIMIWHAVRDARFVLTDSEFTRQDILRLFRIRADKVIAVHLGISKEFRILPKKKKEEFRIRKGLVRPYVLFVGNPKPHKGIVTLRRAFFRIAPMFPEVDLVMAGGILPGHSGEAAIIQIAGMSKRVKMLGQVPDSDLIGLYNCAEILVMPSLYEGFGLPALEAMACGTSVIVSDAGSLPEIVGDAALIFEAGNPDSLADSIDSLLRNRHLRTDMIERGKRQVRKYSWKETARKTLEVYERVLAEQKTP
jgi:alpha-1,3-rhamnosyl/mannosyltransferase